MKRTAPILPTDLAASKRQTHDPKHQKRTHGATNNGNAFTFLMQSDAQRTTTLASAAPTLIKTPFQILDRFSKFIGHSVHVTTKKDVTAVQAVLKSKAEFKSATHNIQAWRFLKLLAGKSGDSPDDFIVEDGYDEDGETGAGRKLWVTMRDLGACDCMVIVTRWYGGTELGPVRFDHINNVGKAALEAGGFVGPRPLPPPPPQLPPSSSPNHPPISSNILLLGWKSVAERDRLLRLLKARDASIRGFRTNIEKHRMDIISNAKTIRILSKKPAGTENVAAAGELLEADCKTWNEATLKQDEAEKLVQERDIILTSLKARLADLKEVLAAQEQHMEELTATVAAEKSNINE
ncbi:ribosomal protein S5 domain 2-like protein [Rhizoclosmatium globosum]|uniref:Ribosomal protein S5 domain 2-like protein n=1 Tax=Rhizoclosmatium globosum TaxID=329046 RepID=A0A1Y2CGI1_9FUNG|nr:ribosomal protein S5 domain 2-like protein [Rhizoclosmatium globosum]|eukprot:ORY46017.1 ribosomal protein S5 domain 2-like protein [Rhizoclosmatium globosum]